jgi:hypothetical protein
VALSLGQAGLRRSVGRLAAAEGLVEHLGHACDRVAAAAKIHAILAGQAGERDPERTERGGGPLDEGEESLVM